MFNSQDFTIFKEYKNLIPNKRFAKILHQKIYKGLFLYKFAGTIKGIWNSILSTICCIKKSLLFFLFKLKFKYPFLVYWINLLYTRIHLNDWDRFRKKRFSFYFTYLDIETSSLFCFHSLYAFFFRNFKVLPWGKLFTFHILYSSLGNQLKGLGNLF